MTDFHPVPSPTARLARSWRGLAPLPGGRWLFSRLFAWSVPYSGSVRAVIVELEPGFCRSRLADRRSIRNHLRSIHAVALINLGELTSGLAMTMALTEDIRGIVTALTAEYPKKARGALSATARVRVPEVGAAAMVHDVDTEIMDSSGDLVCKVRTSWRLERRG